MVHLEEQSIYCSRKSIIVQRNEAAQTMGNNIWNHGAFFFLTNEGRRNRPEYYRLNRKIQKTSATEKSKWYDERCEKFEKLYLKHNYRERHKKIKQMMQTLNNLGKWVQKFQKFPFGGEKSGRAENLYDVVPLSLGSI